MANRHRGEISAELDGRERTLCLTLGALAELEASFGVDDLVALAERRPEDPGLRLLWILGSHFVSAEDDSEKTEKGGRLRRERRSRFSTAPGRSGA